MPHITGKDRSRLFAASNAALNLYLDMNMYCFRRLSWHTSSNIKISSFRLLAVGCTFVPLSGAKLKTGTGWAGVPALHEAAAGTSVAQVLLSHLLHLLSCVGETSSGSVQRVAVYTRALGERWCRRVQRCAQHA